MPIYSHFWIHALSYTYEIMINVILVIILS